MRQYPELKTMCRRKAGNNMLTMVQGCWDDSLRTALSRIGLVNSSFVFPRVMIVLKVWTGLHRARNGNPVRNCIKGWVPHPPSFHLHHTGTQTRSSLSPATMTCFCAAPPLVAQWCPLRASLSKQLPGNSLRWVKVCSLWAISA
jgi:hypothetical protein